MMTGACQCGALRLRLEGAFEALYVCHCSKCRRFTGSAFAVQGFLAEARVALEGRVRGWEAASPSGARVTALFCPVCGVRLAHRTTRAPGMLAVSAGALDVAVDLSEAVHIWTESRLPGVAIPEGAVQWPGEPPG